MNKDESEDLFMAVIFAFISLLVLVYFAQIIGSMINLLSYALIYLLLLTGWFKCLRKMDKYKLESLLVATIYALFSIVILAFLAFITMGFVTDLLIYILIYLLLLKIWYIRNRKKAEEFSYTALMPE